MICCSNAAAPRRLRSSGLLATGVLCAVPIAQAANPFVDWDTLPKEEKVYWSNAAGIGVITAWGISRWDYGSRPPHAHSEGWFGPDTATGGADKLGHFYTNYVVTHALASAYERWGYTRGKAAAVGALSSFGILGYMELGDSFSDYGFSYEDLIMNGLGSYAGYLLYQHPDIARKIDIRLEVAPDFDTLDVFTDYEQMKYVLAVKLDGFETTADTWLRFLDIQAGYYTRGYDDNEPEPPERNIYVGVGVNLSHLFGAAGYAKTAKFFNYYQTPHTYVAATRDLND